MPSIEQRKQVPERYAEGVGRQGNGRAARLSAAPELVYRGIDFSLNQQGEILSFDANATMVVEQPDADPLWDYRRAVERIHALMHKLLLTGAGSAQRISVRP